MSSNINILSLHRAHQTCRRSNDWNLMALNFTTCNPLTHVLRSSHGREKRKSKTVRNQDLQDETCRTKLRWLRRNAEQRNTEQRNTEQLRHQEP